MKKLFSVMLVLALCGFASAAAVDIYLTGPNGETEITVAPSDYVELLVYYLGDPMASFDMDVTANGNGTILGGAIVASVTSGTRNTTYDIIGMPGYTEGDIELGAGTDMGQDLVAGLANPLATISFHCDDNGDVTFSFYDEGSWGEPRGTPLAVTFHGMTIHQIPEPATIALLCLGGLLLRKKR